MVVVFGVTQEMCNELYNVQFDSSQDWLDGLMEDDHGCLVEDCMLMSAVGSSLNAQAPLVSSEHSYSLAADCSCSAAVVKTQLDDCTYCSALSLFVYVEFLAYSATT